MKHQISNIEKSASLSWKAMMVALLCLLTALPMSGTEPHRSRYCG